MTVTLDTKTLNVEGGGIEENVDPVATFVDRWISGEYRKQVKVFGTIRSWTLRCYENDIAWASSNAKYFQDKMKAGDKLSFSIDEGNLHQVSGTYVYILDVDVRYPKGATASKSTRYYTLKLQEAPS